MTESFDHLFFFFWVSLLILCYFLDYLLLLLFMDVCNFITMVFYTLFTLFPFGDKKGEYFGSRLYF
jgi:hypothetical protein